MFGSVSIELISADISSASPSSERIRMDMTDVLVADLKLVTFLCSSLDRHDQIHEKVKTRHEFFFMSLPTYIRH